ncbi:hypothetical protein GJ744_007060 [Endocarpon pusillum]|uniref:Uncharacterized protein n=1 Tax=Endocarpon pusillum TaxID=364733 RepID=A0A8H7E7W1_9EURO|nr:hypothetical protein GJ744_007060 [Endocarpon pusillum]
MVLQQSVLKTKRPKIVGEEGNVELLEGTVKLDSPTPSLLDKDWFCAAKGDKEQGR